MPAAVPELALARRHDRRTRVLDPDSRRGHAQPRLRVARRVVVGRARVASRRPPAGGLEPDGVLAAEAQEARLVTSRIAEPAGGVEAPGARPASGEPLAVAGREAERPLAV